MESFQIFKTQAVEKFKVADHLISTTYPMIREPKLLVSVIENLYAALELSITALIEYEKSLGQILSYNASIEGRLDIFQRKIMSKYEINQDLVDFILVLKKTCDEHKKSNIEFRKKDTFVVADNDYNLIMLDFEEVKKTLAKTKNYMNKLFDIAV